MNPVKSLPNSEHVSLLKFPVYISPLFPLNPCSWNFSGEANVLFESILEQINNGLPQD